MIAIKITYYLIKCTILTFTKFLGLLHLKFPFFHNIQNVFCYNNLIFQTFGKHRIYYLFLKSTYFLLFITSAEHAKYTNSGIKSSRFSVLVSVPMLTKIRSYVTKGSSNRTYINNGQSKYNVPSTTIM